jgi:magnesium transporter
MSRGGAAPDDNGRRSGMSRMKKLRLRAGRYSAPGTRPGTLATDPEASPPEIQVIAYGPDTLNEVVVTDAEGLRPLLGESPVLWVNVYGVGHGVSLQAIGDLFDIHPLTLEDVSNVHQRAKVEPYGQYLFVIARMPAGEPPETEQISMILGPAFVLTFQERPGDHFDPVRERIRAGRARMRGGGASYLAYALIDAVVDSYFPVLDQLAEELEALEEEVLTDPSSDTAGGIHSIRRTLLGLRKVVGPHAVNALLRGDSDLVTSQTELFLRDVYDHTVRITELAEAYRELSSDLMSMYLSAVSNRMNEVMKVLTIIASIFIPLGFIAGLYGMNFDPDVSRWNMPELGWPLGYPFALLLMLIVGGGFLWFVWRKGWLR